MVLEDWILGGLFPCLLIGAFVWSMFHEKRRWRTLVQDIGAALPPEWATDQSSIVHASHEFSEHLHQAMQMRVLNRPSFYCAEPKVGDEAWLFASDGSDLYSVGSSAALAVRLGGRSVTPFLVQRCTGKFVRENPGDEKFRVVKYEDGPRQSWGQSRKWMICDRLDNPGGASIAERLLSDEALKNANAVYVSGDYLFIVGYHMSRLESYFELLVATEQIVSLIRSG